MAFGPRFAVEAGHRDNLHRDTLALRLALDGVKRGRRILRFGDEDPLNRPSTGLDELEHGVATFHLFAAETFLVARRTARATDLTTSERPPGLARCTTLGRTATRGRSRTHEISSINTTALAPIPS